jgi:hypothetical protein
MGTNWLGSSPSFVREKASRYEQSKMHSAASMEWTTRGDDASFSQQPRRRFSQYQVQPPDILSRHANSNGCSEDLNSDSEVDDHATGHIDMYAGRNSKPEDNALSSKLQSNLHEDSDDTVSSDDEQTGVLDSRPDIPQRIQRGTTDNQNTHLNAMNRQLTTSSFFNHHRFEKSKPLAPDLPARSKAKRALFREIQILKKNVDEDEEDEHLDNDVQGEPHPREYHEYNKKSADADKDSDNEDSDSEAQHQDDSQKEQHVQQTLWHNRGSGHDAGINGFNDDQNGVKDESDIDASQHMSLACSQNGDSASRLTNKAATCGCVGIETKFHSFSLELQKIQENSKPMKSVIETVHDRLSIICSVHETQKENAHTNNSSSNAVSALADVCNDISTLFATFSADVRQQLRDIRTDISETNRTMSLFIETARKKQEQTTTTPQHDVVYSAKVQNPRTTSGRQAPDGKQREEIQADKIDERMLSHKTVVRNVAGWHEPATNNATSSDSDSDETEADTRPKNIEHEERSRMKMQKLLKNSRSASVTSESTKNIKQGTSPSKQTTNFSSKKKDVVKPLDKIKSVENTKSSKQKKMNDNCEKGVGALTHYDEKLTAKPADHGVAKKAEKMNDADLPKGSRETVRSVGGKQFAFVEYCDDDSSKSPHSESEESSDDDAELKMNHKSKIPTKDNNTGATVCPAKKQQNSKDAAMFAIYDKETSDEEEVTTDDEEVTTDEENVFRGNQLERSHFAEARHQQDRQAFHNTHKINGGRSASYKSNSIEDKKAKKPARIKTSKNINIAVLKEEENEDGGEEEDDEDEEEITDQYQEPLQNESETDTDNDSRAPRAVHSQVERKNRIKRIEPVKSLSKRSTQSPTQRGSQTLTSKVRAQKYVIPSQSKNKSFDQADNSDDEETESEEDSSQQVLRAKKKKKDTKSQEQ